MEPLHDQFSEPIYVFLAGIVVGLLNPKCGFRDTRYVKDNPSIKRKLEGNDDEEDFDNNAIICVIFYI